MYKASNLSEYSARIINKAKKQNHANFTAHMASHFTNYTKLAVLP